MRRELERDYQTVLSSDSNGSILVQGSEVNVNATVNKLQSLMATLHSSRTHPHPAQYPVATEAVTTSFQRTSSGRDLDRILCELPSDVKQAWVESVNPTHRAPPINVIPRSDHRESRISYFMELGYSHEKVEAVLCNLPGAPDDVILSRLGQCTTPHPVKRVPVGADVSGSVEPPPMRPVNPELLRHIVIDGSNVAMR